jgi:hypothetical protein
MDVEISHGSARPHHFRPQPGEIYGDLGRGYVVFSFVV